MALLECPSLSQDPGGTKCGVIRPSSWQVLKGLFHLLDTNSIQGEPGAQDTFKATCRNVSPSLKLFQDCVSLCPAAHKVKVLSTELQVTLPFAGIYSLLNN